MGRDDSRVARVDLARRNEDLVFAENALIGERTVSVIRMAMLFLIAAAQALSGRQIDPGRPDLGQWEAVSAYWVFALGVLFFTFRIRKAAPGKAMLFPFLWMAADYGFFTFMGITEFLLLGVDFPEKGAITFGVLLLFSLFRYSGVHLLVSTVLTCACYVGVASFVRGQGHAAPEEPLLFVTGVYAAMGLMIGLTRSRIRKMFHELRRRDNLTRLLSPQVAERVMASAGQLAPVQREVTVLFTDLRGFTTLSEQLSPRELLEFLHDFLGRMARVVKAHDGMVNKYLGDGMLAVWNVPDLRDDHALNAARAALDMRLRVEELNAERASGGLPALRIGVGIHTGLVAAGMIGGADLHEYTVIGDAVNLASRIEGLTKDHGVDILVSERTRLLIGERFAGPEVGATPVRGRKEPVVLHALEALAPHEGQRRLAAG